MLNVQRLRVFREVVAEGSFSRAADKLDYTQSAVSQAVATLEAEVGATLIDRDRRGLRATAAGTALVQHADSILGRLQAAEEDLAAIIGLRGGRLRLASFPTAGATLMPRAIARFRDDHPGIDLSLVEGEPEDVAPRLRAGEIDLALLFSFPGTSNSLTDGLAVTDLFADPMYVALPADHRLAGEPSLALEDLRDEAWVQTSSSSPCARHVVRCCHAAGFEPVVSFESDDYQTVQGLVGAGVGVALVPELALAATPEEVAIRELSPSSPTRRVIVATSPSPRGAPAAEAMRQTLIEVTAERAAA